MRRLQEEKQPSLFPAADSADEILWARRRKQQTKPLPIRDARALEETKCVWASMKCSGPSATGWTRVMSSPKGRPWPGVCSGRPYCYARRLSKEEGSEVPVEKFYRMMDAVNEGRIRRLQDIVSQEVTGLLGGKVDVLFFDVTTLSFASDSEDELWKKGYSKDGNVQVVFALIQTTQGLPIRYELSAGNTTDVKTIDPAIAALQQRFALGKVVFVADAGRMSQENLALLLSKGYDFVVAARLRSMGKKATRDITAVQEWQPMAEGRMVAERRLGGRYCPKKAAKDATTGRKP